MSLETITVARQLPIINSYVQLPNNNPSDKTSVPVDGFIRATGGVVKCLSQSGGKGRNGGRHGTQEWVEFEEALSCCESNDAIETGKTAYGTNLPE